MSGASQQSSTTPNSELATTNASQPVKPDTKSSKKPPVLQRRNARKEFLPGQSNAIFSTELGTREPRPARPPYPPVIVRGSDPIKAVVDAARTWQKKFKWQCLCVFPFSKWDINDLWDAEDLHLDSPGFCQKMLTFIAHDTLYEANKFADAWLQAHPDHIGSITDGDLMMSSNSNLAPSMVDRIFVFGETESFPRTFLWHVAQIMRSRLADQSMRIASMRPIHGEQPLRIEQQGNIQANYQKNGAISAESDTTRALLVKKNLPTGNVPQPSSIAASTISTPAAIPVALNRSAFKNEPVHGPSRSFHHRESTHDRGEGKLGLSNKASNVHLSGVKSFKGRNRNMRSASYNHPMPPPEWTENIGYPQPGPYSRHVSGTATNVQSPQFHPAAVAIGQPIIMQPFGHSMTMIPQAITNPHFDPGASPRGILPGQPIPTQAPAIGQAYLHQPLHAQNVRGIPIGDVTNTIYYSNNTFAGQIEPRAPPPRRANNFYNNGVLFDPYGGANPRFSSATTSGGGNKSSQHGFAHHGRLRKFSNSSNRSGQASYGSDRLNNPSVNRFQHSESALIKAHGEDDHIITGDLERGCHQFWIGTENTSVDELFVGDLPEDIQEYELRELFEQFGVKPTRIVIKSPREAREFSRWHAFVSFSNTSEAKKAFQIRNQNPTIRNGSATVAVSIPRRFFQKDFSVPRRNSVNSGSFNNPTHFGRVDGRDPHSVNRRSSRDEDITIDQGELSEQPIYSPQDARSDLNKKEPQKSEPKDSVLTGSPEIHKLKTRQNSTAKENTPKRDSPARAQDKGTKQTTESSATKNFSVVTSVEPNQIIADINTQTFGKPAQVNEEEQNPATSHGISEVSKEEPKSSTTCETSPSSDSGPQANTLQLIDIALNISKAKNSDHENLHGLASLEPIAECTHAEEATSTPELAQVAHSIENDDTEAKVVEPEETNKDIGPVNSARSTENDDLDNEEKNDDSFISAQESLADGANAEPSSARERELEPLNQDMTTPPMNMTTAFEQLNSKGTDSPRVEEGNSLTQQLSPLSTITAATEDQPQPDNESLNNLKHSLVTSQGVPTVPVKDLVPEPSAPAAIVKDITVTLPRGSGLMPPSSGTQHVESLSPFAKPSKAQQRKEKEAKKKQQKKAEAERAKAASSSSKTHTASFSKMGSEAVKSSCNTTTTSEILTGSTASDGNNTAETGPTSKKGKKKAKVLIEGDVELEKPIGPEKAIEGELPNDNTSEPGSPSTTLDLRDESNQPPVDPPNSPANESNAYLSKKTKDTPTLAHLKLPSRALDTSIITSSASSTTLKAEEEPIMSPSPLDEGFYTPQQTPLGPIPAVDDAAEVKTNQIATLQDSAPKKKRKPKKRSKKSTGISNEPSGSSVIADNSQASKPMDPSCKKTPMGNLGELALMDSKDDVDEMDDSVKYGTLSLGITNIDTVKRGMKYRSSCTEFAKANNPSEQEAEHFALKCQINAYMKENASSFLTKAERTVEGAQKRT